MNSDQVKSGVERAPHRSLLKADGYSDEQIRRPFVGVVNSFNEIAPGHVHLQTIARAVKDGVLAAGGTPMEFNTIGVCDGIAMGHKGMHFSLSSRELIADTIECMVSGHCFDALVFIPNCDKIVPGMLMAACLLYTSGSGPGSQRRRSTSGCMIIQQSTEGSRLLWAMRASPKAYAPPSTPRCATGSHRRTWS